LEWFYNGDERRPGHSFGAIATILVARFLDAGELGNYSSEMIAGIVLSPSFNQDVFFEFSTMLFQKKIR
jgi:hypothetical protein